MALSLHKWLVGFFISTLVPLSTLPFDRLRVDSVQDKTFSNAHAHPFYVGVVEVAHNKANAALEISCKLFAEDVEAVLEQQYKTTIDFEQAQQQEKINRLVADYVPKHLKLTADGKEHVLQYVGFEREAESLYAYFECSGVPAVKALRMRNSLLYDFTDKQINIMHITVNGVRKSQKLDYPDTEVQFGF